MSVGTVGARTGLALRTAQPGFPLMVKATISTKTTVLCWG